MEACKANAVDIQRFVALIRKYKEPEAVTDLILQELIDKIVVYEAEGKGIDRTQRVDIYFNYVGAVNMTYIEKALAEMKASEERKEADRLTRQREREKSYREKRTAKKIAENGGESIKKKVCPYCGKEFVPASNRQIFCCKQCRQTDHSDKKRSSQRSGKGGSLLSKAFLRDLWENILANTQPEEVLLI